MNTISIFKNKSGSFYQIDKTSLKSCKYMLVDGIINDMFNEIIIFCKKVH